MEGGGEEEESAKGGVGVGSVRLPEACGPSQVW